MYEWQQLIQTVVNEMDDAIMRRDDQALTLRALAARLHYSEYHATHKFREIAGMSLRTYLHQLCRTSRCTTAFPRRRPLPAPSRRSTALPPVFTAAGPAP